MDDSELQHIIGICFYRYGMRPRRYGVKCRIQAQSSSTSALLLLQWGSSNTSACRHSWKPSSKKMLLFVDTDEVGFTQKFRNDKGFAGLLIFQNSAGYDFHMVGRALKAARMLLETAEHTQQPFYDSTMPGDIVVKIYPFIYQYRSANNLFEGILLSDLLGPHQKFVILKYEKEDVFSLVKADDQKFFRVEARKHWHTPSEFKYVYTSPVKESHLTADTREMYCGSTFFLFDQRQCKEINSHPEGKFVITYVNATNNEVTQLEVPFIKSSQRTEGTPYIGKGQVNIGQFSVLRF
eukprot:GHVS01059829.1.p1 GENE.GHVS01059829.1~~GHVS01059829.1.p1  ORF type:complete len:294 (+),score=23.71 GHVS01059829.1:473-1354(+)